MDSSKTLLILVCALAGAALAAEEQKCREGWALFQGSCYRVFQGTYNWLDASLDGCFEHDGYLAALTSEDENAFVKGLVSEAVPDGDGESAWFGAEYDSHFGGWRWDYTSTNFDYTDWAKSSVARRDILSLLSRVNKCGRLSGADGWSWKEGDCDERHNYFVCEQCLLQEKCSDGSCYTLSCRMNYPREAQEKCAEEGGYLAEITTEEEHTAVKKLLRDAPIPTVGGSQVEGILIGATDRKQESEWVWSHSGATIDMEFSGWGSNQPNNSGIRGRSEDCLALDEHDDFSFNDVMCSWDLPYLCERPESKDVGIVG